MDYRGCLIERDMLSKSNRENCSIKCGRTSNAGFSLITVQWELICYPGKNCHQSIISNLQLTYDLYFRGLSRGQYWWFIPKQISCHPKARLGTFLNCLVSLGSHVSWFSLSFSLIVFFIETSDLVWWYRNKQGGLCIYIYIRSIVWNICSWSASVFSETHHSPHYWYPLKKACKD